MVKSIPIFRAWVPEWLIRINLFILILPSIALFFLPLANINAAAGYYGGEPADMQFAVALFYAGYVGFYSLERRFFNFLAAKEYFLVFIILQIVVTLISYNTKELYIFLPVRFIQGMLFGSMVNLSLSLMFTRLKTERAREVSFSVFFGILLCVLPFNNLATADFIDSFDFNIVYKCAVFAYIPGLSLLLLTMNSIRLNAKLPLYQLDWQSFSLYGISLSLLGYVMIYGQEYYWLEDARIRNSVLALLGLMLIFILRQKKMKRSYIDLDIFKFSNFKIGLVVLFVMYICRFASGLTNNYFANVLRLDPIHISYINIINMAGLVSGVFIACVFILQKRSIRMLWIPGFILLLLFHIIMYFQFDVQANEFNYFIPLFVQGLGVGLIMVPTIVFTISSVTIHLGPSAAAVCLATRYFGFITSIAILNYLELYEKGRHFSAFQDYLTRSNPVVKQRLASQTQQLISRGMPSGKAVKGAHKLLNQAVNTQSQIRYAMDYYEIMAYVLMATILLIVFFPSLNRTVIYLKSKRLSPS